MLSQVLDCVKIFENGNFTEYIENHMFSSWQSYTNSIYGEPRASVWYDKTEDVCFGEEKTFHYSPNEFSFFSQKGDFVKDSKWGKQHLLNLFEKSLGSNLIESKEYIIQDHPALEKFKDKTILLIGGGPSTNDIDWRDKNFDYDYAWSCNNFFMNPEMDDMKISLAALGPTVNLEDERLINYVKNHNTLCMFEGGISPFREHDVLIKFRENFPEQVAYYHLRYFSKLGTIARQVCLAVFLGVKKIYFIGMDGYPGKTGLDYKHAFEDASLKKTNHDGRIFSYHAIKRQYVIFWDYLLNTLQYHNVTYQNLGEGHPANLSSEISRNEFPLQIQ